MFKLVPCLHFVSSRDGEFFIPPGTWFFRVWDAWEVKRVAPIRIALAMLAGSGSWWSKRNFGGALKR